MGIQENLCGGLNSTLEEGDLGGTGFEESRDVPTVVLEGLKGRRRQGCGGDK